MDKETALEKIKKLLSLAQSNNPNEAEAALRQARKLMEMHQLDMNEVHASEASEEKVKTGTKKEPPVWMLRLSHVCAAAFNCHVITYGLYVKGYDTGGFSFRFIGVDLGPELSKYAFEVLERQLQVARREFVATQTRCKLATKRRRGDEFANAWIDAVRRKISDFAGIDERTELAITAFKVKHYPDLTTSPLERRPTHGKDYGAREAGFKAGKSAQLNRGVVAAERQAIGRA